MSQKPARRKALKSSGRQAPKARTAVEAEVKAALEQAWQTVKPFLKRERDGAHVTSELLNFKMRRGA